MERDLLDRIRIASPCPLRWRDMEPRSEGVRFCGGCARFVYRFESLRADAIRDLIERTEGRLCAVLHRRPDGSLMTADCPRSPKRVSPADRGTGR